MSIQKVVESEGHGSFYAVISFSLAVFLYPMYHWLLPFISSGFLVQVDSAILILGATSVITGILFAVPIDQGIDWIIKYKVGHESRSGKLHYLPTRQKNNELMKFTAGVDYLSSTWRTPSWISIEDSCEHSVTSAMKDPKIKQEIWTLKNRSVVGFVFVVWGLAISTDNLQISYLSMASVIIGLLLLFLPWMQKSSTRLPTIIRQVAVMRYAEDIISNWQPLGGREQGREDVKKQLAKDFEGVEILISDKQWERLDRLYALMTNQLVRHNKADYQVKDRVYEIWARAIVEIVSAQNEEEPTEDIVNKYQCALDIFRRCGRNKLPAWAESLTSADLSDFPKFMDNQDAWKDVDPYYSDFHHEIPILFEDLTDTKTKVNWMNALVTTEVKLSKRDLVTFFRFACQYTGSDINVYAYNIFVYNEGDLPFEDVTIVFIDKLRALTDSALPDYEVNLSRQIINILVWLARRKDIKKEVRERIVRHAEKYTNITEWFEKKYGSEWKDKLLALNKN